MRAKQCVNYAYLAWRAYIRQGHNMQRDEYFFEKQTPWIETFLFQGLLLCAGVHPSKYWMPIHYDTIEDGQNKIFHRLFSKYIWCDID